jgi:hypothetical protein
VRRDGLRLVATTVVATLAIASPALAQAPALRQGQLTISGGLVLGGSYPVGDRAAEIRTNTTGTPPPFTLFRAESTIDPSAGVEGRVGFALTRDLEIEGGASYAKPQLSVTISQDPESSTFTITDTVSRYVIDVNGVYHLPVGIGTRARPYVLGGAGYLRELHADRLLVESGQVLQFGGGVRYWLRGASGKRRALTVRAEVRAVRRRGGIDFEERDRTFPVIAVLGSFGL